MLWQPLDQCLIAALTSKSQGWISSCCGNHLSQRQMITQTVNLLVGYQVGNSQENLTRSLFLLRVLYIQSPHGLCY